LLFGAVSFAVVFSALVLAWYGDGATSHNFLAWLTSYGGSEGEGGRESLAYGFKGTFVVSFARSLYGAFCSFIDIQPLVGIVRDHSALSFPLAVNALAAASFLILIFWALIRSVQLQKERTLVILYLSASWLAATILFGFLWNNSDDQFFFHCAVISGLAVFALADAFHKEKYKYCISFLLVFVLAYNAFDLYYRDISFPRAEKIQALETALEGSSLVIIPGGNAASMVVWFAKPAIKEKRVDLMSLSDRFSPEEGYGNLKQRVADILNAGGRVDVVDIFDTPPYVVPWKHLDLVGYEKNKIIAVLSSFPVEKTSRWIDGFSVRSIKTRQ
jgi:hypothetical protein